MKTPEQQLLCNFLTFCMEQPPHQKINHTSWSTCAVGDFMEYIGEPRDECGAASESFLAALETDLPWLEEALSQGNSWSSEESDAWGEELDNYGCLVETTVFMEACEELQITHVICL